MSISKSELIAMVAADTELPKSNVDTVISATLNTIANVLANKNSVALTGFGTFSSKFRPEHIGRNPHTGEDVTIKEAWVPSFKPGKTLKDRVAG